MLSGLPVVMDLEEINPFLVSLAKSAGSIFHCHSHLVICKVVVWSFDMKYLPITFMYYALQLLIFINLFYFFSISGKP